MERPVHETLWLSCGAKRCCSTRTVRPTGADIWRIATTLQVKPETFLRTISAPAHDADAFLLDTMTHPLHIALARRVAKGGAAACIFLVQLGDHTARCGLGTLRPMVCHTFPAVGTLDIQCADDAQHCTCRTWTVADIDRGSVRAIGAQEAEERQHYRATIREWNALVSAAPAGTRFAFADFCQYIVAAYSTSQSAATTRGAI